VHHEECEQIRLLREILKEVKRIRHEFPNGKAESATLTFKGDSDMPATILVGATATATFLEWTGPNGTGSQIAPVGPVTYASDNTAVATVDPNTGIATGVSAGTANISGTDAGNNLTASDVLTVTAVPPPVAVSATLTLVANASAKAQATRRA
jgi:uncharacterized protein YjdB